MWCPFCAPGLTAAGAGLGRGLLPWQAYAHCFESEYSLGHSLHGVAQHIPAAHTLSLVICTLIPPARVGAPCCEGGPAM